VRLHLIHAALVHLPIAFLGLGGSIEAAALFAGRPASARFGGGLVLVVGIALVPTIAFGFVAANAVAVPAAALETLEAHERNGWILLAAVLALVVWKAWHRGQVPEHQRAPYALGLLVVVALVVWGAWLGGQLVYRYGVGVGVG
jgi:uncharacterized membrane protein